MDSDAWSTNNDDDDFVYEPDFKSDPEPEEKLLLQNRMKMPNLARAVQRNFLSDRAAAGVATSAIYDFVNHYKIKISESAFVTDKNKVRREINNAIENTQSLGFSKNE